MAALCRRAAIQAGARGANIPLWSSDIQPVRGYCRGGTKRKPCRSRWAVPRVSLDFTDPTRIDRLATLECASCGRTWRRIPPTDVRSPAGYLRVRLTIILPATATRWYSHGTWHRTGDDAQVLRNATVADLDEAVDRHRERADKRAARLQRARDKREAAEREAIARGRAVLAAMDEANAAREAEEAAAAAREAAQ